MSAINPESKVIFRYKGKSGVWLNFCYNEVERHLNIKPRLPQIIQGEKLTSDLRKIIEDAKPPLTIEIYFQGSPNRPPSFRIIERDIRLWSDSIIAKLKKS